MNSDGKYHFEEVMESRDVHANLFKNAGVEVAATDHPGHPFRLNRRTYSFGGYGAGPRLLDTDDRGSRDDRNSERLAASLGLRVNLIGILAGRKSWCFPIMVPPVGMIPLPKSCGVDTSEKVGRSQRPAWFISEVSERFIFRKSLRPWSSRKNDI